MAQDSVVDSRRNQRILATREGQPAFWLVRDGDRLPLYDLSLEGFSVSGTAGYALGMRIAFRIALDGAEDQVSGEAEVANLLGGTDARTGFHIRSVAGEGRKLLHAWLVDQVRSCASIPISEQEAADLVAGPSII